MSHKNIALFVAHAGCQNTCTFCNQRTISGKTETATADDVKRAMDIALSSGCHDGQLAFFGGSFTAIDRDYMISLLEAAHPYVLDHSVTGIRISTRPDAIDDEILELLKFYGVEAIELGAQSMDERVLALNKRGHTAEDVRVASKLIKSYDFELGLQMMTGLYGDTDEGAVYTAKELIALSPKTVRIYPTVVLEGTELASLYKSGEYKPQTLDEAVELCAKLLEMFENEGIKVIRLGLHSGGGVEEGYIAGAYHPALRELCESKLYYDRVLAELSTYDNSKGNEYKIFVNPKEISKMTGQKRINIVKLKDKNYFCKVFPDERLKQNEFYTEVVTK